MATSILSILLSIIVFLLIIKKKLDARLAFLFGGLVLVAITSEWKKLGDGVIGLMDLLIPAIIISLSFGFASILKIENYGQETLNSFRAIFHHRYGRFKSAAILIAVISTWVESFTLMSASAACGMVTPIFFPILLSMGLPAELTAVSIICGAWGSIMHPGDINCNSVNHTLINSEFNPIDPSRDHFFPSLVAISVIVLVLWLVNKKLKLNSANLIREPNIEKRSNQRSVIAVLPFLLIAVYSVFNRYIMDLMAPNVFKTLCYYAINFFLTKCAVVVSILIGCVCAFRMAENTSNQKLSSHFLKGSWNGILDVVFLIAASNIFIIGVKAGIGEDSIESILTDCGKLTTPIAVLFTFAFAALTGSGDAIIISIVPIVANGIKTFPILSGNAAFSMIWFAGELGRCASPVSAATLTVAKVSKVNANKIACRAFLPVFLGLAAAVSVLYLLNKV